MYELSYRCVVFLILFSQKGTNMLQEGGLSAALQEMENKTFLRDAIRSCTAGTGITCLTECSANILLSIDVIKHGKDYKATNRL